MEKKGVYGSWEEAWDVKLDEHSKYFVKFFEFAKDIMLIYIFIRDQANCFNFNGKFDLELFPGSYRFSIGTSGNIKVKSKCILQQSVLLRLFTYFENWLKNLTYEFIRTDICQINRFFRQKHIEEIGRANEIDGKMKVVRQCLRNINICRILKAYKELNYIEFDGSRHSFQAMKNVLNIRNDIAHEYGNALNKFLRENYLSRYPDEDEFKLFERFFDDHLNAMVRCAKDIDKKLSSITKQLDSY